MIRGSRLLLILAGPVLVLLPLVLADTLPKDAEKPEVRARVGAWNIEWLGNKEKRFGPGKGKAQEAKDLAGCIEASKVELLALSEIAGNAEEGERLTNSTLTEVCKLLKERGRGDWQHVLFSGEEKDSKDQLCGVAWNGSRWKLEGKPFRIPIRRGATPNPDVWRRVPHAVKFSSGEKKTDVVLIPVHMKSNSGGGVTQRSKTRAEEARALIRSLGAVQNHFSDDDVLILGDFNCLLREEPALVQFRSTGFRDLNFADQLSWIKDTRFDPAPFDRILVPDEQPEFRDSSFTVFKDHGFNSEREFREKLSDHYLVWSDMRIMDDDD